MSTLSAILQGVHTDEVWNISWSHDGSRLASASKDQTAIIWLQGPQREWTPHAILRDHSFAVVCITWSPDDSILATSASSIVKLWDTETGACIRTLDRHTDMVSSLVWLPNGTGLLSGSMDRSIILWDQQVNVYTTWAASAGRIVDFALTPNLKHLVAIEIDLPPNFTTTATISPTDVEEPPRRITIYDYATREIKSFFNVQGGPTNIKVSRDSLFALISHAPNEIHIYNIKTGQLASQYSGHHHGQYIIQCCFGGTYDNFILSGSEDGKVHLWHRDTGKHLEILAGHEDGLSVNGVAWNPCNTRIFASCSDDRTIRIWETRPR